MQHRILEDGLMKVIFHEDFYEVYTPDPAAAPGRMEAVWKAAITTRF
jgi:hypothetical protein